MRFTDTLDRKLEEIARPANPPRGHYIWQVSKHPDVDSFDSSKTGKTFDRITYSMQCVGPSDDIDPDDLAEYGNVVGYVQRKTFMFDTDPDEKANFERNLFNHRQFLGHLGVDENLSTSEAMAASIGAQCLGELKHRPDPNDTEVIYAEIGRTSVIV